LPHDLEIVTVNGGENTSQYHTPLAIAKFTGKQKKIKSCYFVATLHILLCGFHVTHFSKIHNLCVWREGVGLEDTVVQQLDLTSTRSGFPTDIYEGVLISP
jgi:hypothetical protein